MNTAPTHDELTPQIIRLRQFLAWLVPIAISFALLETAVFLLVPLLEVGAAVVITSSYLCCLLIAQRFLRQGQVSLAVSLMCGGLLAVDPLIVVVWPAVLPALAVVPVVVVAIALPYLDGKAMRRLIGISMAVAILVIFLSEYVPPFTTAPLWVITLLRITTVVAVTLLALLLLEQFRSRLTEMLMHMHAAQQRLEAQNERLAVTLQSIGDGVMTTDAHGTILTLNHMMEHFTGWTQAEAVGKSFTDILVLVDPAEHESHVNLLQRVFQNQLQLASIAEALLRARDMTTRYVSGTAAALHNQAGVVVGVVLAFHDISEQKRAEEERVLWERQILETQKLESLGVLAGGIAHDFNNLLTGILGNASLVLDELAPSSPERDSIKQIETAALRAAELTRQMLAYAGKGRFVTQSIDLNELIVEMAALLKASIAKHVALQFDLAAHLPPIEGDSTQIRQIVMNLIMNAAEAIGESQGSIRIKTQLQQFHEERTAGTTTVVVDEPLSGDYIVLDVIDTGSGMDAATIARIFEPFFTTKFTGRGLGLAAVMGIIRGHHGHLQVTSEVGKGTIFSIFLPIVEGHVELLPAPTAHRVGAAKRATVLVVDDDAVARSITTDILQHHAFTVIAVNDGQDAVDTYMARCADIDCVLLDLIMPRMNGIEALQRIHQINAQARVVLMSGYSEQEATKQIAYTQLAGFLEKPFTMTTLLETIGQVLS
jgi:two-component system, cell cycle sensor histidine kinase and response regulator CckA